jgi:hypothetical protein
MIDASANDTLAYCLGQKNRTKIYLFLHCVNAGITSDSTKTTMATLTVNSNHIHCDQSLHAGLSAPILATPAHKRV